MSEPIFLSLEEVLRLHHHLIAVHGGDVGVINPAGLEAAVAQPMMTAFGELLHREVLDQAAAYLFHFISNHPFCDGNKRIGMHTALVFLVTNGYEIVGEPEDWYQLAMGVARGELRKAEVSQRLRDLVRRV